MSSTLLLLTDIRNNLLTSIGITFIVLGTVGNLLNIILFSKRALWTLSPCVPYLLAASVTNIMDIYSGVMFRMLVGFKITPTFYSSAACKLQLYLYYTLFCLSSWFIVGCCADRFFSSSRSAITRTYSSTRMTTIIMLAITMIIPLVYSQVLFCWEANQFSKPAPCAVQNDVCNIIDIIYYFIFQAIGPPVFMLIFGIGTFIHIRQGRQIKQGPTTRAEVRTAAVTTTTSATTNSTRRNGREILPMLTIQVTLYIICTMPFVAMKIYTNLPLSTVKSSVQLSVENLILNMVFLLSFIDKVFSFYIYTLSSKYYRKELIQLVTRYGRLQRVVPQT